MKVPELRFPEFEDEWEEKKLGETLKKTVGGGTPSRKIGSYWNGIIPWASVKDFDNNKYKTDTLEHITEEGLEKSSSNLIPPENLVISTRMGLGRVFINKKPIAINQDLKGLIPNEYINIEFLYYWFIKKSQFIESLGKGSTVKGVRLEELHSLNLSIPSLEEQEKVASFLSKIDKKIEKIERKVELWQFYKKGIIQQLFSQELRFKDVIGSDYPDWKERKFSDILFEHKEKSTGNEEVFSISVHKGLINQIEHLGRVFAAKDVSKYNLVKPGDIVYTKSPTGDFHWV